MGVWCFVFGPCFAMQYLVYFSSFAFISLNKREMVANLMCLFATSVSQVEGDPMV